MSQGAGETIAFALVGLAVFLWRFVVVPLVRFVVVPVLLAVFLLGVRATLGVVQGVREARLRAAIRRDAVQCEAIATVVTPRPLEAGGQSLLWSELAGRRSAHVRR